MKRLITGLLLVIILLGTFACAEAAPTPAPAPVPAPAPAPAPAPPPVVINIPPAEEGIVYQAPAPVIEIPPAPASVPSPEIVEKTSAQLGQSWATERMIVRTGNMELVVVDVAGIMEQIASLAGSYDGYVVSSNSWREGDRLVGNIAIRVPAERYDITIRALRQMAVEVNMESTTSTDVTEEYVDLSSRLHNLEASEEQLLKLMEKAGEVNEILEVQRELTKTRGEIEQTTGRMQYLEQTSSTSLINVQLQQAELDVSFTASNRTVKVGQDIRFEPRISGGISPYSYEWDFGDGNTSTDVAPMHSYRSDGSYNVTFKVTDDRGQTASRERKNYIDVLPGWNAGNTARSAWNGLATIGRVVVDILIWIVYLIPVWIVIGVILYFAWWRRRKRA